MRINERTILVVEDAPMIRTVCVRALAAHGFEVLQASYAEEALRVWSGQGHRVDLALVDVYLPGRSGLSLAADLIALKPDLNVVLMSAKPAQVLAEYGRSCEGFQFLHKPFRSSHLIDVMVSAAK